MIWIFTEGKGDGIESRLPFKKISTLSTLQMFTGVYGVSIGFPAISMEEGCKNHREILYSSKGKIVYVLGKPSLP